MRNIPSHLLYSIPKIMWTLLAKTQGISNVINLFQSILQQFLKNRRHSSYTYQVTYFGFLNIFGKINPHQVNRPAFISF